MKYHLLEHGVILQYDLSSTNFPPNDLILNYDRDGKKRGANERRTAIDDLIQVPVGSKVQVVAEQEW